MCPVHYNVIIRNITYFNFRQNKFENIGSEVEYCIKPTFVSRSECSSCETSPQQLQREVLFVIQHKMDIKGKLKSDVDAGS